MDWLRSEDLKEEKVLTTSTANHNTPAVDLLVPN